MTPVAVVLALALTACGGGGGGGSGGQGRGVVEPDHTIDRIGLATDTLLVSDLLAFVEGTEYARGQTRCRGTACTISILGESDELSLSDILSGSEEWPSATETYRGISLYQAALTLDLGTESYTAYGGWLDHNFFIAGSAEGNVSSARGIVRVGVPLAMSIGDATGTNPASAVGSATWSGVMVGADVSATASRFNTIRGDADLTIADLAAPSLDVAFTGIRDTDAGGQRADMIWTGIPLTGGSFDSGFDGNSIQGKFYGPNHQEVGGIFERDKVIGAFGAKRQ